MTPLGVESHGLDRELDENLVRYGTRVSKEPAAVEVTHLGVDWKTYQWHKLNKPRQNRERHEP